MNKNIHRLYVGSFFLVGIAVTFLLAYNGYQYYSTPFEERFFQLQHSSLKPSGPWGHGLGIIGTLMMILGVALYMIRKRVKSLFNIGYLKHWLEFHIFLCTVGPILVLYHTAFKFGGIVSVSFWSMTAVVLSGVVGRFLYVQIPRSIQGHELGIKELSLLNDDYNSKLFELTSDRSIAERIEKLHSPDRYKNINFGAGAFLIFKDYFETGKEISSIKRDLKRSSVSRKLQKEVAKVAKNKIVLTRRIGLLRTVQNLFRYWHIVHLPFAIVMFVIMIVHVAVTIAFGYKWIF